MNRSFAPTHVYKSAVSGAIDLAMVYISFKSLSRQEGRHSPSVSWSNRRHGKVVMHMLYCRSGSNLAAGLCICCTRTGQARHDINACLLQIKLCWHGKIRLYRPRIPMPSRNYLQCIILSILRQCMGSNLVDYDPIGETLWSGGSTYKSA